MAISFDVLRASVPGERKAWSEALATLPPARRDVYFCPEYVAPFERVGRGEALALVARDGAATLVHPFLRAAIDPALTGGRAAFDLQSTYGYGGPTVNEAGEDPAFLAAAWAAFGEWATQADVVAEFVRFHPLLGNERFAPPGMDVVDNRLTVVVDLAAYPDAIWNSPYYRDHRHMVRRAERAGYVYETLPFTGDVGWFKSMYDETQARLQAGSETSFDLAYFEALRDFGDHAWLGAIKKDGELVGAVLVLDSDDYAHCHLMGYRSDKLVNGLTNFAYHGIYLEAARRGRRWVHMGGGTSGAEDDRLLKFKRALSPETRVWRIGKLRRDATRYDEIAAAWEAQHGPRPRGFFTFYRLQPDRSADAAARAT